jgi:hypothetical protein
MVNPVSVVVVVAVAAVLAVAGLAVVAVVVLLYLGKDWSPGSGAQMGVEVIPCWPQ